MGGSFNGMSMMRFSNGSLAGMSIGSGAGGSTSTSPIHKLNLNNSNNRSCSATHTMAAPTASAPDSSSNSYIASSMAKQVIGAEPISQAPSLKEHDHEMTGGSTVEGHESSGTSNGNDLDGNGYGERDTDGATRDSFNMAAIRRSLTSC